MKTRLTAIFIVVLGVMSYRAFGQCGTAPSFASSTSSCNAGVQSMTVRSTGIPQGNTVQHRWYTTQTGGTAFTTTTATYFLGPAAYGSTYSPNLSSTTTYWVSTYCNSTESTGRTAVTFTRTAPGTITIATSVSTNLCAGDPITLTPQNCNNCGWITGASGPGAITVNPTLTTTYTVSGQETICNTTVSKSVTVNVSPKVGQVSVPTGATYAFCQGAVASTTYSASATNADGYQWTLTPAGAGSINSSGVVTWNAAFSGTATVGITAFSPGYCTYTSSNSRQVTIYTKPTTPTVSSPVSVQVSTSPTLSASGAISGETYRWYNSSNTLVSTANTFSPGVLDAQTSYTYYVTRYHSTGGCETPYANKATIVVNLTVPTPSQPVASTNTCFDRTLTFAAVTGVTWYLQTSSTGTALDKPVVNNQYILKDNGTYWVRGKANSLNLWGTAIQLSAWSTMVNPENISLSSLDPVNTNVKATSSIKLTPGFVVTSGQIFSAKIEVTPECNNQVNWSENIVYDENQNVVGDSRIYLDGNGGSLQTTIKDFVSGRVMATQPLFNYLNVPVGSTLIAPIQENDFIYKPKFTTDASGNRYTYDDFDLRSTNGTAGEVNNPKPMGIDPGTVGWYYSTNNNIEVNTPTTSYPYSRSFVPEGPDPLTSSSAGPGDAFRMGNAHEIKSDRSLIAAGELDHYFAIRPLFVAEPPPGTNMLAVNTLSTTGYATTGASTTSVANGYIDVLSTASGTSEVRFGGAIAVTSGKKYVLSVRGYVPTGEPQPYLFARINGGAEITGLTKTIPLTTEDWTSIIFTVPGGVTQIQVGVKYNSNQVSGSSNFFMGAVSLKPASPVSPGYRIITADQNGNRSLGFIDPDGDEMASAVITGAGGPPYTLDFWNYTFFNDAGSTIAEVDPKDVNLADFSAPIATTYKYDHFGRLIEVNSPDEGISRLVYSVDGKIRFSENQVQRDASPKRFSYTNYDKLGRPIESGEYTSNGTNPYVFEPHTTATPATWSVLNVTETIGFSGVSRTVDATRCSEFKYTTYDVPLLAGQSYVYGNVSKTENATGSTWYSYNENGQLEWTIQNINGLGNKRIDYTYDFFGNISREAYQDGVAGDKFYHHYEYDANQRLKAAYTSFDGVNKTLQARYHYYLHGPLKRVELAGDLQGIDYVYTIDGSLKSINSLDANNDPGGDGSNGFEGDVFGQTLSYYDSDYVGAGYSAPGISATGISAQYNGLVRYNGWFSPVDNSPSSKAYGYTYDRMYQIQNAQFSTITAGAGVFANGRYRESIPETSGISGYDKNGNIKKLVRADQNNSETTYTYNYNAGKNSVSTITGGANTVTYTYNSIGQLTQQVEGSVTMKILYNVDGLVSEIRNASNQPQVKYYYDDRGSKFKKEDFTNGTLSRTTFYVSDASGNVVAIYDNASGSIVKKEVPIYASGRIGIYKPEQDAWFYEVSDNLGNVRAVIGPPKTTVYTATMESETPIKDEEDSKFKNIAPRVSFVRPSTTPPSLAGNEAVALNNTRITGPGIILKVAPGDVISANVYAYYEGCTDCANTLAVSTTASSVAQAFGGINGGAGEPGRIFSALNGVITGGFAGAGGSGDNAVPAAYLNMITFNNNLDAPNPSILPMSAVRITSAANMQKEQLTIGPIDIPSPGWVYIYVSNSSNSTTSVYFDDLEVIHNQSPLVAGADYYPFGLAMPSREILIEPYRYGYQGQYAENDSVTKWNAFELRMYDPRFGRWISPDPYGQFASPYLGMGNNPVIAVDPNGGEIIVPVINGLPSITLPWFIMRAPFEGVVPAMVSVVAATGGGMIGIGTDKRQYYFDNSIIGRTIYRQNSLNEWHIAYDEAAQAWANQETAETTTAVMSEFFTTAITSGLGGPEAIGGNTLGRATTRAVGTAAVKGAYRITSVAVRSALTRSLSRRGFTEVGYQFQKHFGRGVRGWDAVIPKGATMNPATFNEAGYKTFQAIWKGPGGFKKVGRFWEKRLPDGRGIRFQQNWVFKGFLD